MSRVTGSGGGGGGKNRRRSGGNKGGSVDIWREPEPLPAVEPIQASRTPGDVVRSLGDPPMSGGYATGKYFRAAVERAAAMATALAVSVDLLDDGTAAGNDDP